MTAPHLATYAVSGIMKYGLVTDRGIVDLSARFNYPNPPVMAVLLEPFALLPPVAGALTWYAVKAALALIVFAWAFRMVEAPDRPLPFWVKAVIVAVSLKPVLDDLSQREVEVLRLLAAGKSN